MPLAKIDKAINVNGFHNVVRGDKKISTKAMGFSQHLWPYKFIMVIGPHCSGKTSVLRHYKTQPSWTATVWRSEPILDMLYIDKEKFNEKHYNLIQKCEKEIIPDMMHEDLHQVIVEGWYLYPSSRRRMMGLIQNLNVNSLCIIFDGPADMMIDRAKEHNKLVMDDEELEFFVANQCRSFNKPDGKESFNNIMYVNTFGQRGIEHLRNNYVIKKS